MIIYSSKINTNIFHHPESIYGNYDFTKTNSFEEAWNLCKFTYDSGYKEFSNLVRNIQFKIENKEKLVNAYKPVGSSTNVPRFLTGIPNNMRTKEKVYINPTINIYYQFSYNCQITENQIRNRGVLTLALINYLENIKKYNIILNFESIAQQGNELIIISIKLKNINDKLNVKKCYFPIVHPSFLRRLEFRAEEIIPYLKENWSFGYGRPLNFSEAKIYLKDYFDTKNGIYISTPDELCIRGDNINNDADNFIKIINSKYSIMDSEKVKKRVR